MSARVCSDHGAELHACPRCGWQSECPTCGCFRVKYGWCFGPPRQGNGLDHEEVQK